MGQDLRCLQQLSHWVHAAVAAANAAAKWTTTAVNTFAEEEEPIRTLCCFVLPPPFLIDTSLATYSPVCQVSVQSGWRHCRLKTSKRTNNLLFVQGRVGIEAPDNVQKHVFKSGNSLQQKNYCTLCNQVLIYLFLSYCINTRLQCSFM